MRELKYRVWDTHTKTFIFFGGKFWFDDTSDTITFQCTPVLGERDPDGDRFIFQQFTGLYDKNDKEIYEGDVGEMQMINEFGSAEIKRGVMEMHTDGFWSFRTESNYDLDKTSPPIVIGNIYENPDLLT